ncbi:MAG: OmpA family protein [bacterium]
MTRFGEFFSSTLTLGLAVALTIMSGCSANFAPPIDQSRLEEGYRQASTAIRRAESLDAQKHSPDKLKEARELLEKTFERQKTDPSNKLIPDYDRVAKLARQAALDSAEKQLEQLKNDTDTSKVNNEELRRKYEAARATVETQSETIAQQLKTINQQQRRIAVRSDSIANQHDTITALRRRIETLRNERPSTSARASYLKFDTVAIFDSGSARLKPSEQEKLDSIVPTLKQYDNRRIEVRGLTDTYPVADDHEFESNWELSAKRAISVVKYLVYVKGIEKDRISANGMAELNPGSSYDSPLTSSDYRRVEIVLLPPDSTIHYGVPESSDSSPDS